MCDLPNDNLHDEISCLRARIEMLEKQLDSTDRQYLPSPPFRKSKSSNSFMRFSTCSVADFLHPRYLEICQLLGRPFHWHRKQWEFVFIIHHLLDSGILLPGSKGLVFGVGKERLPAVFASMGAQIVATDAPFDIIEKSGWKDSGQHVDTLEEIYYPTIVSREAFFSNVSFQPCDMNNIPSSLADFDFNWSSCCFEHLGSVEAGLQFVVNAVEKTLRIGGVAVHTTEFNLSSNKETIENGLTVLYRKRDLQKLARRLKENGHIVKPFIVAADLHYWDFHVDVPPYTHNPHLKLRLEQYVVTSAGIVVQRGR